MKFLLILIAIAIFVEFIGMLWHSGRAASGITWFISHPFGVGVNLFTGVLIRAGLLIIASIIIF